MLFAEDNATTPLSWMGRDLDLLCDAIDRRRAREDAVASQALDDTVASLTAVKLIYERLADAREEKLDADAYLASLLSQLRRAYVAELGIRVSKFGTLGDLQAVIARDVGLIVVELVSASVRHGLRRGPGGIAVKVTRTPCRIRIIVGDDGFGAIDPFANDQRQSFEAVRIRASDLGATLSVNNRPGLGSIMTLTSGPLTTLS